MSPEEKAAAIWFQQDARYTYAQAAIYRDRPGAGPWVACKVQRAAAWSAAQARALLCGDPVPVAADY